MTKLSIHNSQIISSAFIVDVIISNNAEVRYVTSMIYLDLDSLTTKKFELKKKPSDRVRVTCLQYDSNGRSILANLSPNRVVELNCEVCM